MKLYNKAWSVIKGWPLAWMLLLTGASLVFNNSHYQIAAKKSPPNQGSNEEIFEMRTKPVPDKIFNLVLTSDVKMKEASDDDKVETNEKNNKIAHLDWIAIESYRATRDAADETKNISDYTLWGFWASLLAVFFSFIGIVLVKRTLDAANKANNIAQDTAENTNRAWCYPHIDNDKTGLFEHPYLIFKYRSVFGGSYTETRYWETIKIKSDDHTSLNRSTPPEQIERKMQDLINRTNHTQLSLRG